MNRESISRASSASGSRTPSFALRTVGGGSTTRLVTWSAWISSVLMPPGDLWRSAQLQGKRLMNETNDAVELDDDLGGYTAQELLEQAQINAQALFLGTAEALSSDLSLLDTWVRQLALTFIRGWDTDQAWEPPDILFALVTNYQSFGLSLIHI